MRAAARQRGKETSRAEPAGAGSQGVCVPPPPGNYKNATLRQRRAHRSPPPPQKKKKTYADEARPEQALTIAKASLDLSQYCTAEPLGPRQLTVALRWEGGRGGGAGFASRRADSPGGGQGARPGGVSGWGGWGGALPGGDRRPLLEGRTARKK